MSKNKDVNHFIKTIEFRITDTSKMRSLFRSNRPIIGQRLGWNLTPSISYNMLPD